MKIIGHPWLLLHQEGIIPAVPRGRPGHPAPSQVLRRRSSGCHGVACSRGKPPRGKPPPRDAQGGLLSHVRSRRTLGGAGVVGLAVGEQVRQGCSLPDRRLHACLGMLVRLRWLVGRGSAGKARWAGLRWRRDPDPGGARGMLLLWGWVRRNSQWYPAVNLDFSGKILMTRGGISDGGFIVSYRVSSTALILSL